MIILKRANQGNTLELFKQSGYTYLKLDDVNSVIAVYEGQEYRFPVNREEYTEGVPTPVYFGRSRKEFVVNKNHDKSYDANSFAIEHDFGQLCFSVTWLEHNCYITCAIPIDLTIPVMSYDAGQKSTMRELCDVNPDFLKHPNFLKRRARLDMMAKINPTQSLTDLEKQVDLLTKIILRSGINMTESEQDSLQKILDVSSFTYKSDEEVVADIISTKSHIRDAMKEFNDLRNSVQ